MKYLKYIITLVAFLLWWYNLDVNGVQNGSAYIQHVDGLVLVAGSGALAHYVPKLVRFMREHHELVKKHHDTMKSVEKHLKETKKHE